MPVPPLDDRALEALLSGVPAQSGFDWLVPFVEDLEKASQEPAPVVRPVLALLLKEGFTPANGANPLVTGPAPAALPPAPSTERAAVRPVLRGVLGRVAGLGLLAKAGLGFSLVAASTTAAGAAGVLPGPAQHAVAKVVGAATPFNFPDKASDKADHGRNVSADATGASDGVAGVDGKIVSGTVKNTGTPGNGSTPASSPPNGTGVGPSETGATGLDRANETPAAGHVPTSVPAPGGPPATPGLPGGPETPKTTPAASKTPPSVTVPTPAGPPATAAPSGNGRGPAVTAPGRP